MYQGQNNRLRVRGPRLDGVNVPVTHLSNKQIDERKTLVEKANKVLATKGDTKSFRSMQKKIEKMIP